MKSHGIKLRLIDVHDVEFILELRLNKDLNKYLHAIPNDIDTQINWINTYKKRENIGTDFYFVIIDNEGRKLGLVRVYEIDYIKKTFTWGSFIVTKNDKPKYTALEGSLRIYQFAFMELGLEYCKFEVNINNTDAINFYNKFGAKFIYSDQINSYYEITKQLFIQLKYSRYYNFF